MTENKELSPESLWKYFYEICAIPRPSKKEEKIIDYIIDFAVNHNLEYIKDSAGNIVIRKDASDGYENRPAVILQAHLDMVCQKNSETVHDFEKDPVKTYIDGEWVKAQGTTLGADNGIGVAAALAVLESKKLLHGPVEALFTVDEETGMTGAFNLNPDALKGRIMINLDSEDEGEICIGCAGGLNSTLTFEYTPEPVPSGMKIYKISLTGLKGGHSGVDINLGRGNANKLMNRMLWTASREFGLRIADIEGGSLRNAIPRESFVTAAIPSDKEKQFLNLITEFGNEIKNELSSTEPDFSIKANPAESTFDHLIDINTQEILLNAVYAVPDGVIHMIKDMPDIVETSTNLAVVRSNASKNIIEVMSLLRSSSDSAKTDLSNVFTGIADLCKCEVNHEGSYPGWKPDMDSKLLQVTQQVYKNLFNKKPDVKVIHAGLECGIIGSVFKGMDMVSIGPTIKFPHSPDEKLHIPSVRKFWDFLVETLKAV